MQNLSNDYPHHRINFLRRNILICYNEVVCHRSDLYPKQCGIDKPEYSGLRKEITIYKKQRKLSVKINPSIPVICNVCLTFILLWFWLECFSHWLRSYRATQHVSSNKEVWFSNFSFIIFNWVWTKSFSFLFFNHIYVFVDEDIWASK